jgi:large subunit ribosomal protein L2
MPPGTQLHNVEAIPGEGGFYAKQAGQFVEVMRRMGNNVVVKHGYLGELALDHRCMASVGRVSQVEHETVNRLIPQRTRWLGFRMHSGLWHRKDGYCGKKIRPPKPLQVITAETFKKKEQRLEQLHILE